MKPRLLYASFDDEHSLLHAVQDVRSRGVSVHDAYTPHPVHGLDEAMGLPRSRLPWVTAIGGGIGLGIATLLQWWTSAVDWTLNIGGKPFASWPAFGPVMFELMVLIGGLSTAAALLLRSRLLPRIGAVRVAPGATDDRYVLALADRDGSFNRQEVESVLRKHGARDIRDGGPS